MAATVALGLRLLSKYPALNSFAYVLRLRPNSKMGGVDATWYVALMVYVHARWNRANMQFVADSMRQVHLTVPASAYPELPVTAIQAAAKPEPTTRVGLGDVLRLESGR